MTETAAPVETAALRPPNGSPAANGMPRGARDSGWGRTGPDSLADFTDVIWINTTSSKREFPF